VNLEALRPRAPASSALPRYGEAARAMGHSTIDGALEELRGLRASLGVAPLAGLGVTEADIAPIVKHSRGGSMKYNPIELTDRELEAIVRAAMA
jgi:alcohol dehydrogenase class IV